MYGGGDDREVARWLRGFLAAHAKREHPGLEVELEAEGEREGTSYAVRLRLGSRVCPTVEFDFAEVAGGRGTLAWCQAQAEAVRRRARDLLATVETSPTSA